MFSWNVQLERSVGTFSWNVQLGWSAGMVSREARLQCEPSASGARGKCHAALQ